MAQRTSLTTNRVMLIVDAPVVVVVQYCSGDAAMAAFR